MGACPVRVISFENYSVDTVGAQIKAVDMPDEFSEKPRILVLACENDAYPALDMAGHAAPDVLSAFVRVIPVRCLGSVNTIWITDALNGGYDGVMMLGCKHGDDYQCHFVKGSELAADRMSKIDDTLKQMALETERVATLRSRDHRHRARAAADQRLRGEDQGNRHEPDEGLRLRQPCDDATPTDLNSRRSPTTATTSSAKSRSEVDEGEWVKMCMQCGVCAGSCPFGPHWEHSPQKIFMMIRAGKREEVLTSDSMWMCTSCYNCVVRCPRKLPITQIMHGLATYAHRLGLAPKMQPTRDFSLQFWDNCTKTGRVNELKLTHGPLLPGRPGRRHQEGLEHARRRARPAARPSA